MVPVPHHSPVPPPERIEPMPAACKTAFEVAFWFLDAALNDNEYLQPQKLQRLMFFAQAYFGALHGGRKLMPAVFVADELGPLEPNVHLALSRGRPDLQVDVCLPDEALTTLKGIWRRFGHHSSERLSCLARESRAYREAREHGLGSELAFDAMCQGVAEAAALPSPQRIAGARVLFTQAGKPVVAERWMPGKGGAKRSAAGGPPQSGRPAGRPGVGGRPSRHSDGEAP
ncbi:MAG: hypothetical protein EA406_04950 [Rhodospirillales bacterium]|nr:MAG: hypothetical protein EA406_04950 [Rhodospirillales bacterium]